MKKRVKKICVVTGSRAEYGLLYWTMRRLKDEPCFVLQTMVTGMHLAPEFGNTYQAIMADGFTIDWKVDMLLSSDSAVGVAKSTGLGLIGFVDGLSQLQPDLLLLLGDRFEIFAACSAAMLLKIPVAHIHGGEITEGAVDESIRHAITKMSQVHFPSAEAYRQRVIQMGEAPERVFNVGAPGLENILRLNLLPKAQLFAELRLPEQPTLLVTFHPETLASQSSEEQAEEFLSALADLNDINLIITKANADEGGRIINSMIDAFAEKNPGRVYATKSLGQLKYLSALRAVDLVVGNSSSGIIEAPFAGTPTINVGDRQKGRLRTTSIIDVECARVPIVQAIKRGLEASFRAQAKSTQTPYGNGQASSKICDVLAELDLASLHRKAFFDLPPHKDA